MPRTMRPTLLLTLLAGATLFFVACDDGGGDDGDAPAPSGTATTRTADEGDQEDYASHFEAFAASSFTGDYRLEGSDPEGLGDGTATLYKGAEDRFRFDITATSEGEELSLSVITAEGQTVLCFDEAGEFGALFGLDPAEGACLGTDAAGGNPLEDVIDVTQLSQSVTVTGRSERPIAGQDADCFSVTENDSSREREVCFGDDGVILAVNDDASTFEATSIEEGVSDTDFDIPYEVQDLGAVGG